MLRKCDRRWPFVWKLNNEIHFDWEDKNLSKTGNKIVISSFCEIYCNILTPPLMSLFFKITSWNSYFFFEKMGLIKLKLTLHLFQQIHKN